MSFFISELIEGYKENFCLICRRGNCKHIQRWKIENIGVWFENLKRILRITKPKKRFYCGDNLSIKGFHSPDRADDARIKGKIVTERKVDKVGKGVYCWIDNKIH